MILLFFFSSEIIERLTCRRYYFLDFQLRAKFQSMDWENPKVKSDFEGKLSNSSILHVCESKHQGESKVRILHLDNGQWTFCVKFISA